MPLKPISLTRSTAYFLVPGLITLALFTLGFDALVASGLAASNAFMLVAAAGFSVVLIQFVVLYTAEGNAWTLSALAQRLRFRTMSRAQWIWTILVFLFVTAAYLGALAIGSVAWYAQHFALPAWYSAVPEQIEGAYWLIGARMGILVLNVMAEELLWRGFILPRQELAHGRWAWLIHGVQWTLFHLFKPWEFLMLLPGCLAYAVLAQWSKNIWPGIIVHFLFNGLGVVLLTLAVFGLIG